MRNFAYDLVSVLAFFMSLNEIAANLWMVGSLGGSVTSSSLHMCDSNLMTRRQRSLCRNYPQVMDAMSDGALLGVSECHRQFVGERWNCTTVPLSTSHIGKVVLKLGSRESAFVYAISSAGVVHSIARMCAAGQIRQCSCDNRNVRGGGVDRKGDMFTWGGCSHNLKFAANFARRFMDAKEKNSRDARSLMNIHNNRVGRKLVRRGVALECKCHGVSGSCTTKTCWNAVPKFEQVGQALYKGYRTAKQVTIDPQGSVLIMSNPSLMRDSPMDSKTYSPMPRPIALRSELVFFEPSPDYCNIDITTGSIGTGGRRCNITSTGPDSCELLCCGRGYNTKRTILVEKCNCKFQWCCEVKCDECEKVVFEHTCKGPRSPLLSSLRI